MPWLGDRLPMTKVTAFLAPDDCAINSRKSSPCKFHCNLRDCLYNNSGMRSDAHVPTKVVDIVSRYLIPDCRAYNINLYFKET